MPNTQMQMLLRGQNVVGYRHYPDDVLEAFVVEAVKVGIDIFRIFDALNDVRNMEAAMKAFGQLPEWFSEVVFSGGTGLISAKETAITSVHLQPGYYVMECYVRMPDGRFHNAMGMAKELIVVEEDSGVRPPEFDIQIDVRGQSGISWNGYPKAGKTVFRVEFVDQLVYENFVGHDLNLVRMEEGADLEALEAWINWATPTGLMSSTLPGGFTFLGGANDAPAGSILYFEAELTPGTYVLISEVPKAKEKGMLKTFTVGN
jgi:hypothetical protein